MGTHSAFGERSHTAAHTAKQGPSLPRPQRGFALPVKFFYSATLLYTYISRFSVNPQHQQKRIIRQSCRHKFYPQPLFNFSYKRPTFAFTSESGYTHSAFGERSHTRAHTAKQVAFWVGVVSLPSERFTRFGNPAWPGIRTANFAAFGSWPGVRQKDAESLRDSDALMRVAVPRRRGPAGLRDLFATW